VLVLEKVPLVVISVAISVVTVIIQRNVGALVPVGDQSVGARLGNAVVAYALYLRDQFYFQDLSVYYPLRPFSAGAVAGAVGVLLVVTAGAILLWRKIPDSGRPVLTGWLWFLGTMVPMIGLVQSGEQGRADRFTYFPSIGLAIAVAWLWPARMLRELWQRKAAVVAAGGVVLALAIYTMLRVELWNDPLAMLLDGIDHTEKNAKLEYYVGEMLERYQKPEEAIGYYRRAVFDAEGFPQAYLALGRLLVQQGHEEEGFVALDVARRMRADDPHYEQVYREMSELAAERAATREGR
jgi:tetratricopeptide (TPR) repeat protein